jgi:hypothetical protein
MVKPVYPPTTSLRGVLEAHKKENCSFRGTTLPQSKISEIKKLYHFGLNFSELAEKLSKYISGDISDTKMRQPSRDIMTEVVLTYTEFFKYTKPSITCSGIRIKKFLLPVVLTTLHSSKKCIWIFITYKCSKVIKPHLNIICLTFHGNFIQFFIGQSKFMYTSFGYIFL